MNAFAFKVIDAINRDGMDNGSWGLVKDVDNTVAYFGTREEIELKGQWAYIYAEKDDTLSLQLEKIEPREIAEKYTDSELKECLRLLKLKTNF